MECHFLNIKITLLIKQRCIQNPNIIKLKKLITSKNSLQISKEIKKKKVGVMQARIVSSRYIAIKRYMIFNVQRYMAEIISETKIC